MRLARPLSVAVLVACAAWSPPPAVAQRASAAPAAAVDDHWAFRALPSRVEVPAMAAGVAGWPRGPIDRFVLARLEQHDLEPSPAAPPERLVRRLFLDLTGLPPATADLDRYLADRRPDRYERLVDELLASPRFGEHVATAWLDAARYADTHGYQADRHRPVWRWRDWVVRAFNDGLGYDEFLTWQLAGDLLPEPTRDQRLATAFNRLHRQTEEGGTIEPEFRAEYVADRVDTFGSAVLGLTLECARCHDHKFDPLGIAEYYELAAFFSSIDESGQTSHFTDATPVPALALPSPAQARSLDDLATRVRAAERRLRARATDRAAHAAWRENQPASRPVPAPVVALTFERTGKQGWVNEADDLKPGVAVGSPVMTRRAASGRADGGALALRGEDGVVVRGLPVRHRDDELTLAVRVRLPNRAVAKGVVVHRTKAALDAANRGFELTIEDDRAAFVLAHMWPGNALKVVTREPLPRARWTHVAVTYDGSSRARGVRMFVDGRRVATETARDRLTRDVVYERGGNPPLTVGHRFRDKGFAGGAIDDLRLWNARLADLEVADLVRPGALAVALSSNGAADAGLADYWTTRVDSVARSRRATLASLRREQRELAERVPEIMVMRELATPRPAFVLERGVWDAPGARVERDTPDCLPPFGERRRDRLGLAEWLTHPDHPLTARVAVNRVWQGIFGRGLVATPGDFGTQGAAPTHPRLLDWLARAFVTSGWDVKELFRTVVTSATYRQESHVTPRLAAHDPDNELFARAPAVPLTAEVVRDAALLTAGLLVDRRGGPPVRPYQPAGLWRETTGGRYVADRGEGLWRRSVYTYRRRTAPPPTMLLFDAPTRHHCVVRRQATITPLQSLALLNDPQFVEAARVFAERVLAAGGATPLARVRWAFRAQTARWPSGSETDVLLRLWQEQRDHYAADPKAARALVSVGARPTRADLPVVDLAATTALAQALLGFDEVLTKR